MAMDLTRRAVLAGATASLTSTAGCVEYLLTGCESQSKHVLILTAVDRDVLRTDPIQYENLSENEQRLVQKTLETGRYEICPGQASDEAQRALSKLRSRVEDQSENGYAYLRYVGRFFQIGLVIAAVYYARTKHHPDETATPTPVDSRGFRTP